MLTCVRPQPAPAVPGPHRRDDRSAGSFRTFDPAAAVLSLSRPHFTVSVAPNTEPELQPRRSSSGTALHTVQTEQLEVLALTDVRDERTAHVRYRWQSRSRAELKRPPLASCTVEPVDCPDRSSKEAEETGRQINHSGSPRARRAVT